MVASSPGLPLPSPNNAGGNYSRKFFFSRIILGEGRGRPGDEASLVAVVQIQTDVRNIQKFIASCTQFDRYSCKLLTIVLGTTRYSCTYIPVQDL